MKFSRPLVLVLILSVLTVLVGWMELEVRSIWPSVVALALVFGTRKVLLGLFGGAVAGSILVCGPAVWNVPLDLVENHLLPNFESSWKSGAVLFTLLLGGFVHLLEKGGVLQSMLVRMLHGSGRRRVETGAGVFGLVCFFDGLANSLMVGRIFQPLAASSGVSKVRLAYIVDTTSAAVACLAFISTWIAYQLAMIREGFLLAGQESLSDPYRLFFASLPHNYYSWFALILMGVAIQRQWNFGPMRTWKDGEPESRNAAAPDSVTGAGLWRAWIPVSALVLIIFLGIYADGSRRMGETLFPLSLDKLALSFAEANVPAILIIGSAVAGILAWLFFPRSSLGTGESPGGIFIEGMIQLFQPVLILVMAWMLSSTLGALEAADYLGQLLGGRIPPALLPVAVFLTGSLVAFTTGTSWGTMGLLMPLAIPLTFSVCGNDVAVAMALVPLVIGAVFSGAVFGDHCSPISDTTIVSSIACGVDPMDHVRTQLPYAIVAAAGAALLGFIPAGLTGWGPAVLPVASLAFAAALLCCHTFSARSQAKA